MQTRSYPKCVSCLRAIVIFALLLSLLLPLLMPKTYANIDANAISAEVTQRIDAKTALPAHLSLPVLKARLNSATQGVKKTDKHSNNPYAFVLFFSSTCPHCKRFAPILTQWANAHHFYIYAFSLNGGSLPSFPHPLAVTSQIRQSFFGQQPNIETPSLFLVNVNTTAAMPLAQGEMSAAQLNTLMQPLLKQLGAVHVQ